jgi:hypothetical protein
VSEQPRHRSSTPEDEASEAGATSEGFGNLSVEDDAEGTMNPADLVGRGGPEDDAVDAAPPTDLGASPAHDGQGSSDRGQDV